MTKGQMLRQGLPSPNFWQTIIRLQVNEKRVRDACSIHFGKHLLGIGTMRDQAVAIHGDPLAGLVVAVLVNPLHLCLPGIVLLYLASGLDRRVGLGGHSVPRSELYSISHGGASPSRPTSTTGDRRQC
jgi:hypothetical protein